MVLDLHKKLCQSNFKGYEKKFAEKILPNGSRLFEIKDSKHKALDSYLQVK